MKKTHFTRKNYIALALVFFFCLFCLLVAICLDSTLGIVKASNPIAKVMTNIFGVDGFYGSMEAWLLFFVTDLYIFLFAACFIFEMRLAKFYENKIFTKKWLLVYSLTLLVAIILAGGIGLLAQHPWDAGWDGALGAYQFLGASLLTGFILYVMGGLVVFFVVALYVNFKHIDEPFRWNSKKSQAITEQEAAQEEAEIEAMNEQGELAASFGASAGAGVGGFAGAGIGAGSSSGKGEITKLSIKEDVFPGLCAVDLANAEPRAESFEDNLPLSAIVTRFRNYLATNEKLYFDENTLRVFIAGLAASRLLILEGLSGTGKSSLARYFSEFISEKSYFEAVQATWRDRTSILGYFNDFSRSYNETEFLKRLYDATYKKDHINIMVLDELNISRVEYYFADFLSVMEYPISDWKLKIMQFPYDFDGPLHLEGGILQIPENTYFIGTANKDDSTYTITDKVYDRAISISFDDRNEPFEVTGEAGKITLSYPHLQLLFKEAKDNPDLCLSKADMARFRTLTDFTYDAFDLTFGNRIANQIEAMVPVYCACGGRKEDALDFMFARKIIAKMEGRYEDYVKDGLTGLLALIEKTYGEANFAESKAAIKRLLRRL